VDNKFCEVDAKYRSQEIINAMEDGDIKNPDMYSPEQIKRAIEELRDRSERQSLMPWVKLTPYSRSYVYEEES